MTNNIDLGAETVAFVRRRMNEVIGEDPQNLERVELIVDGREGRTERKKHQRHWKVSLVS